MPGGPEGAPTPDEVLKNTARRVASDRQLINDGAEANFNAETGKVEIAPTKHQFDSMKGEVPEHINEAVKQLEQIAKVLGFTFSDHTKSLIQGSIDGTNQYPASHYIERTIDEWRRYANDDTDRNTTKEQRAEANRLLDEMHTEYFESHH